MNLVMRCMHCWAVLTWHHLPARSVKRDFVEMPSQMLEEWLWDPEIFKMVSHHYQTGEPFLMSLLQHSKLRIYDSGVFITRQICLAKLCIRMF